MTKTNQIDLRSDTVTKPTSAMRQAMAEAEVGDDVYGEDPTIHKLEALAADILGKEAAVYVPSGTMGNLTSVLAHCGRGEEMILGDKSHILLYEQGGSAALGGVHPRAVPTQSDGTLQLDDITGAIRGENEHYPVTRLVTIENTHNRCGGRVLPVEYMDAVGDLAAANGLKFHVDGARIWNAAVALNVSPARLVEKADSVSACLSKGLGAPVGSVVASSEEFVRQVRRMRKVVGGGMRQAGVIAAAGVVALTEQVERLVDDHDNAKYFAQGISELEGIELDVDEVETDIVIFDFKREDMTPAQLASGLAEEGVLLSPIGGTELRAVTNHHVTRDHIDQVLDAFGRVLSGSTVGTTAASSAYG